MKKTVPAKNSNAVTNQTKPAPQKPTLTANMAHQIADLYSLDNLEGNAGPKSTPTSEKKTIGTKATVQATQKPASNVNKTPAKLGGPAGGQKKNSVTTDKKSEQKPVVPAGKNLVKANKMEIEEEMKMDENPKAGNVSITLGNKAEIRFKGSGDKEFQNKRRELLALLIKEQTEKLDVCSIKKDTKVENLSDEAIEYYVCLLESNINQNLELPIFKCHKKDPNYILRKLQKAENSSEGAAGSNFKDSKFKASPQSSGSDLNYVWRRAKEFLNEGPIKVFNSISPSSIIQGSLGDCYLLSALAVLAENEEVIRSLFITREYQENGMYALWLCEGGKFKIVIMDDYFPCFNENSGPAFSKSKNNELWVLLLEKAYAKIYQSYANIKVGMSSDSFKDLTGAPSEYIDLKKKEIAFKLMKNAQKENFALAASTKENHVDKGLVSGHSYGVLDIQELKKGDYYIKLNNPWQNTVWRNGFEWKGEVVKALGVSETDANKGVFWMDLGNFDKNFEVVTMSRIHKGYNYSFFKYKHTDKQKFGLLKVICLKKGLAYFSVHQKHSRFYRDFGLSYIYSVSRIVLARLSKDGSMIEEVLGGDFSTKQSTFFGAQVEEGQYIVFAEVDFKQDLCQDFVISVYSEHPLALVKIDDSPSNPVDIRKELVSKYIIKNPYLAQVSKYETEEDGEIKHYFGESFGLVYFIYENKSQVTALFESVQALKVKNISLVKDDGKTTSDSSFKVAVQSSEIACVLFKLGEKDAGSHASSFSRKHNLVSMHPDEKLIRLALAKGNKKPRNVGKQEKDVILFSLTFNGGIALAYHNNTEKAYSESLTFKVLENLEVFLPNNKKAGKNVDVKLGPGEKFLIILKIIDPYEKRSGYSSSHMAL